jgi:hypothetical protein
MASTGPSSWCARSMRIATRRSTGLAELSTSAQQLHIMTASGVDPALVEAIGKVMTLAGRRDPQGDAPRDR